MTEKELQEIKERCEKATPGPWGLDTWKNNLMVIATANCKIVVASRMQIRDAEFIAHAREDIPKLLREIEELKKQIEELKRQIEEPEVEE